MNLKLAVCALLGHSRIITGFFGYQYCGRCRQQLGDTIAGVALEVSVGVGHNCTDCQKNYKLMTWRDKFLVPNPFTGPIRTPEQIREERRKLFDEWKRERHADQVGADPAGAD